MSVRFASRYLYEVRWTRQGETIVVFTSNMFEDCETYAKCIKHGGITDKIEIYDPQVPQGCKVIYVSNRYLN